MHLRIMLYTYWTALVLYMYHITSDSSLVILAWSTSPGCEILSSEVPMFRSKNWSRQTHRGPEIRSWLLSHCANYPNILLDSIIVETESCPNNFAFMMCAVREGRWILLSHHCWEASLFSRVTASVRVHRNSTVGLTLQTVEFFFQ